MSAFANSGRSDDSIFEKMTVRFRPHADVLLDISLLSVSGGDADVYSGGFRDF